LIPSPDALQIALQPCSDNVAVRPNVKCVRLVHKANFNNNGSRGQKNDNDVNWGLMIRDNFTDVIAQHNAVLQVNSLSSPNDSNKKQ
jgi:hypothetical protein